MKRPIDLPDVPEVRLPEILNMRPGVYLLVLYTFVVLALMFLIGFLPGILKGGRYVTFTSVLSETGIEVDGTYLGTANRQYFIESGEYEIRYVKAGIPYAKQTLKVDHPVFFTWLFHRTLTVPQPELSLDEKSMLAIVRSDLQRIQSASAILSYDAVTRYEQVYGNLATDLASLPLDENIKQEAAELALLYITNNTMLEDAESAFGAHSKSAVRANLEVAEAMLSGAKRTVGQDPFPVAVEKHPTSLHFDDVVIPGYSYAPTSAIMGKTVPLAYPDINEAGLEVETPAFSLATYETSQYLWALFLEENELLRKANLETLVRDGLVDEYYLSGETISPIFVTNRPVYAVSFYAAQAFCQWLSEKTGKTVFLPTEEMFTVAALSHSNLAYETSLSPSPVNPTDPVALLGGVWEITSSSYIPLARVTGYQRAHQLHQQFGLSMLPIVKGGSYLNDAKRISSTTVGVIEPDACGDFIGFRVAWYD